MSLPKRYISASLMLFVILAVVGIKATHFHAERHSWDTTTSTNGCESVVSTNDDCAICLFNLPNSEEASSPSFFFSTNAHTSFCAIGKEQTPQFFCLQFFRRGPPASL